MNASTFPHLSVLERIEFDLASEQQGIGTVSYCRAEVESSDKYSSHRVKCRVIDRPPAVSSG